MKSAARSVAACSTGCACSLACHMYDATCVASLLLVEAWNLCLACLLAVLIGWCIVALLSHTGWPSKKTLATFHSIAQLPCRSSQPAS